MFLLTLSRVTCTDVLLITDTHRTHCYQCIDVNVRWSDDSANHPDVTNKLQQEISPARHRPACSTPEIDVCAENQVCMLLSVSYSGEGM